MAFAPFFPPRPSWCRLILPGLLAASSPGSAAAPPDLTLRSGDFSLRAAADGPLQFSLASPRGPVAFKNPAPLAIDVALKDGLTEQLRGAYASVSAEKGGLVGRGRLRSAGGSEFAVEDVFGAGKTPGTFVLTRTVAVTRTGADEGFASEFSLRAPDGGPLADNDVFIPGLWYRDNHFVPPHALAANPADERIWIREDRMPLPLVMIWNRRTGAALTFIHLAPDGRTCAEDRFASRLVDARLQFASLGVTRPGQPAATFRFPGTEADRTYLPGPADSRTRGSERFHPVTVGVPHRYQILIAAAGEPAFPVAMRDAWRLAYAAFAPAVATTDMPAVYRASMDLINRLSRDYNGAPGLPFRVHLPKGNFDPATEANFQMGFVGQQLPLAYHLLRQGFAEHRDDAIRRGEATVDFWAQNSPLPGGLPRTWFDPYPQPHWRDYHTFLRVASDGMVGALQSWDVMARHGRPKPAWLAFCRGYGDWLIAHQQADGAWFREYDFAGEPVNRGKQNTTHPIRFLVDLAKATGDAKYARSAERAGEYSLKNIHEAFAYVGGTADNPNVLDKEAGVLAMDAFLALRDQTGDARYLRAAAQAADFAETWVYGWSVPIPEGNPTSIPTNRSSAGFSLIATGHSGADLFMAGAPFLYFRLALFTGDPHYADIARLLLHNPRQFVDVGGSLGYRFPGLCTEAISFAPVRGGGVNTWLPWLTNSIVDPVVRLEEAFGAEAWKLRTTPALRTRNEAYGRTRGFQGSPPVGRSRNH